MKGKLYLIPTHIAVSPRHEVLPSSVPLTVGGIRHFLCENIRTARRYVSQLKVHTSVESLDFQLLDKDTSPAQLPDLLKPALEGRDIGVLSESGCPGVADPGALAVAFAHEHGITVIPLVGPSSILLALMASGLNGQQFAFHGYLPVDAGEAKTALKKLEVESRQKSQTQIFIETPYRNNPVLTHFLSVLQADTRLCVAFNLTAADEKIISQPVSVWKQRPVTFPKAPAVFLFLASPRGMR